MAPGGYFGRALVVDVTDATTETLPLPDEILRGYIGGAGLGAWLMHRLAPTGVDPLGPDAPIAFCFSPLVGTPLTTSAKFAVVAKSPLTGMLNDALASSHFAIAGKLTGNDAIVVRGACDEPSVLLIDGDGARLEPAGDLWGLSAADAETRLRERLGKAWRVASIGPAGERLVKYATVSHDGRHAGRGGLGAVLGSKLIKAIAVRPSMKVAPADPPAVLAAARDLRARSFGPATAKYRELGTLANLLAFNAIATLPTRNFQAATFAEAPALAAEDLAEARGVARDSCASCSIGCEHIYKGAGGRKTRVEYENVFALGPMCAVSDPDAVLEASGRCDDLGLDTISAGGTIAWAMECAERGLIDAPWLRFGDADALLRAIDEIGAREGLGALLAEGSRAAARVVGQGSEAFAPQVKGLELPGYEPRTLQAMALGLAVNARGADHNRSGAYEADLSGRFDRLEGGAAARRGGDRDRGPRGGHGLAHPLQVPARRLRGSLPGVGGPARQRDRLGRRRPRAGGDRAPHRARQARVQRPRGLDALGRRSAGAAADRDARGLLRSRGRAHTRAARRDDRRVLRGAWARPLGWARRGPDRGPAARGTGP